MNSYSRTSRMAPIKAVYPTVNHKTNYSSNGDTIGGSAPMTRRHQPVPSGPLSKNGTQLSRSRLPSASEGYDQQKGGRISRSGSQHNLTHNLNRTSSPATAMRYVESFERSKQFSVIRQSDTKPPPSSQQQRLSSFTTVMNTTAPNYTTYVARRSSSLSRPSSSSNNNTANNNMNGSTSINTTSSSLNSPNELDEERFSSIKLNGTRRTSESLSVTSTSNGCTGLVNLGNTCFMNATLQCMSNCRPLRDFCLSGNYKSSLNSNSKLKGALFKSFAEMIIYLWNNTRAYSPDNFKRQLQSFASRFSGYSQQDAQEFLRYLLDGLHEDVNRIKNKPKPAVVDEAKEDALSDNDKSQLYYERYTQRDNSIIVDLFMGQLKSSLTCDDCRNCSTTFDPFFDLSLPIPKRTGVTLDDCIRSFFSTEVLDGDEKPICSRCKKKRKSTKSFTIQRLPQILVLHLKRFSGERLRSKVSTLIQFPINDLNLSPFMNNKGSATYRLFGVINHSGSVFSGHYTAYCRQPNSDLWNDFNDSTVSRTSERQIVSAEAYVLFYEKN